MNRRVVVLLLAGLALPAAQLLYPGCATMLNGPTQNVRVKSQPRGARVFVDGKDVGSTPLTVKLSRWGFHRVRVELDGYEPYEVPLRKTVNGNAAENLFFGFVPIVIDLLTGAVFELEVPPEARRQMPRLAYEQGDATLNAVVFSPTLLISTTLHPAPNAHRLGQLKKR